MAEKVWDVIVAGAGPAGATLAERLARSGSSVLILEKAPLPRPKTCAGGVTHKTAALLGFKFDDIVEDVTTRMVFSYRYGRVAEKTSSRPLVYMTMRDRFDRRLTDRAVAAGAALQDGNSLRSVVPDGNQCLVRSDRGDFAARVVVGADGFRSVLARQLGLMKGRQVDVAIECEVYCPPDQIEARRGSIYVNYGRYLHGYSWVFPKSDHLSVGASMPWRLASRLRTDLDDWLAHLGLNACPVRNIKSSCVSFRSDKVPIVQGNCLLLGDAAGLADALTGEGIYYAVRSAQLAAPAIEDFLQGRTPDLSAYQAAVDAELMPQIKMSQRLARVAARMPLVAYHFVTTSGAAWNAACRLICGEATYPRLHMELTPFKKALGL